MSKINLLYSFLGVIYGGVLPMVLGINYWVFRGSFIYKSGLWVIATLFIVVTAAYITGLFGLVHLFWGSSCRSLDGCTHIHPSQK